MVKLSPRQQEEFVFAEPDVFVPGKGARGRRSVTKCAAEARQETHLEKSHARRLAQRSPEESRGISRGRRKSPVKST